MARYSKLRKFSPVRTLQEGEGVPRGFGRAWINFDRRQAVVMPVPFNQIASVVRKTYYRVAVAKRQEHEEQLHHAGYRAGFDQGKKAAERTADAFWASRIDTAIRLGWDLSFRAFELERKYGADTPKYNQYFKQWLVSQKRKRGLSYGTSASTGTPSRSDSAQAVPAPAKPRTDRVRRPRPRANAPAGSNAGKKNLGDAKKRSRK